MHQLSRQDARRIAVRAQLLDARRPTDLQDVVRHLTLLQVDQVQAVAPSADLVAWSRLGSGYAPAELQAALAARVLVELQMMVRPAEDLAFYLADMAAWDETTGRGEWEAAHRAWLQANDACRRDILHRLDVHGPHRGRDLPDTCVRSWGSSGWNNNRNVGRLLELMEARGEVAVSGHEGRDRLWDLAERVYPEVDVVPADEARRTRNELRLRSLGLARARATQTSTEPNDVGEVGEVAVVEGVRGQWRVDPSLLGQPFAGRTALLSPLDRLVYDRKRMAELFAFDYQLEMYKPAAKRRWGYYALPVLHGDRLVGKVDATTDRTKGVLRVDAIHEDEPFGEDVRAAVRAELEDLAQWLELDPVLPR
ncbi:DNA glycosylase AlkZ-like family protein [Angustibacter luteus]|uniref:DNA glycosylase AlkZ-like family protein n=1 Tax=Angustibacter luteus TaxID=658456 RepID=A0ABW1JH53_9ACTN